VKNEDQSRPREDTTTTNWKHYYQYHQPTESKKNVVRHFGTTVRECLLPFFDHPRKLLSKFFETQTRSYYNDAEENG
jgi:hypothetical protein